MTMHLTRVTLVLLGLVLSMYQCFGGVKQVGIHPELTNWVFDYAQQC